MPRRVSNRMSERTADPTPRWRRWIAPALAAIVLFVVLRALQFEIAHLRVHDIMQAFRAIPLAKLALAMGATLLAYAVLPGYDFLALMYAGHPLPWRRVAYGSTVTYGISQTLGFAALTGSSVRLRLWSAWGLTTEEIARAASFSAGTFSLGVAFLFGLVGVTEPTVSLATLRLPVPLVRTLAGLGLVVTAAYVAWGLLARGRELTVRGVRIGAPRPPLLAGQLLVAVLDWTCAAAVLYVLLPDGAVIRYPAFVGIFLLAQTAGLLSHVPGGLGVFESLMVLQVGPSVPAEQMLGALLAYRAIFYLLPFLVAVALLAVHELRRQRDQLARTAARFSGTFERWAEPLLPNAIGAMTMVGGAILLLSGATPAERTRVGALLDVIPLGAVELSHFAGSVAGSGLLVLGWALTRRLDAAYHLARVLLVVGIAASLLKGLDVEEATALTAMLALLSASHGAFYRRSSLLAEPLTPNWIVTIGVIVGVSVWVGLFSFRHAEYSSELWWQFAARADVPRFLRASAGAATVLGVVAVMRLLRTAPPELGPTSPEAMARVTGLLPVIEETGAALALLGDKQLLFADNGTGFVMYGVSGRTWVALGDPFGNEEARRELAWRFREDADRHGAVPVFYEVSARFLPLYIDLGLTLLKMGEEAIVPLDTFSLDGGARRGLRRTQRELQKAGATFEVVDAAAAAALFAELRAVSNDWLAAKSAREKGFSLGYFDERYLAHFPHALVRVDGRIVAFANLWTGNGKELSLDLMRYASDAPSGVMEYLFIELMLWGRARGFSRLSLGMAPLAGLEERALAPAWHRVAGLVYRHGEHFYGFQGLRAYKDKFDPEWEPRYLATPAGLALPRVLADVTALISGGIGGVLTR